MARTVDKAIVDLFEDLEVISQTHGELTDTDVRETLYQALNFYFIWGRSSKRLPRRFCMFSPEADALVASAFRRFLETVEQTEELSAIPLGQARLDLLQSPRARTASGMLYDEFIGHGDLPLPPELLPNSYFATENDED